MLAIQFIKNKRGECMQKKNIILSLGILFALLLLTSVAAAKAESANYAKYNLAANSDEPGKCTVQFGSQNTALLTYFSVRNRLVLNQRIALFSDTYGLKISSETIAKTTSSWADAKQLNSFKDHRMEPIAIVYS